MATWDGSAPDLAQEIFEAEYPLLKDRHASTYASWLDRVAYLDVTTACALATRDRAAAIAHLTAHKLEMKGAAGVDSKGGGPLAGKTTERGSRSYAVAPIGTYFGVHAYLLQRTEGGRNLLELMNSRVAACGIDVA